MSKEKKAFDVNELAVKAAAGDDKAMAELITQIMPVASAKASYLNFGKSRISDDDLVQEGMLGFLESVKKFDPSKGISFKTFADTCIENRIKSALRSNFNSGNAALSGAVSFDESAEVASLVDPAAIAEDTEQREMILKASEERLSKFELAVLKRRLQYESYSQIAAALRCSEKSVDNALQRIRRKLRDIF